MQELEWINAQHSHMISLVERWANINTGSDNFEGITNFRKEIQSDFTVLGGEAEVIPLPSRKTINLQGASIESPVPAALRLMKRREAPIQLFFGGHMDTVFTLSSPFQKTSRLSNNTLRGPGVTDMKGGLAILLKGLEAFERSRFASSIGWEIVLNPDEEVGSVSSDHLFVEGAKRNDLGIIFEPAFSDGAFVHERKGSANYTIITRGRASHVGRDFHQGKNAIFAMSEIIKKLEALNDNPHHTTVNVGYIHGGGPVNIVPDFALCRLNIRMRSMEHLEAVQMKLADIVASCQQREGISATLHKDYSCPPKPFDSKTQSFFESYKLCAAELNIPFKCRESGGVCDGNRLSAAGLATLDSAGAIGGNIHTEEEYLNLDSLTERARLLTLFLIKLATGEIPVAKEKMP